jgi:hypothetical protein
MTGGGKKRLSASQRREIEKYVLEIARDTEKARKDFLEKYFLDTEKVREIIASTEKVRPKKRRGRPRSVPAEDRATSNAWRDKRRREAYAKAREVFDYITQSSVEATRRVYKEIKKEHRAELWAEMDRMCKAPPKD